MNNEDFTQLVRQKVKTTKDIARDAVEDEFRRKKRKIGGGKQKRSNTNGVNADVYSSDSDTNTRNKKKNTTEKRQRIDINKLSNNYALHLD